MGFRKKKNIIILTICMVICFILYQLYFFNSIASATAGDGREIVFDHTVEKETVQVHPESDKYINLNGVIKGVLYYDMPKYRPDSKAQFKCLKSEQFIPFEQVNDDYCDCEDASDEPSTSACINGTFYCDTQSNNKRVPPNAVPSSKVNDGICDCCDGSDESDWHNESDKKLLTQANKRHYRFYDTQCLKSC